MIFTFNFDAMKKEFSNFKRMKHVPVKDYNDIDLEDIIITTHPDYFLLVYKFVESYNFVVWGLAENNEITSFSCREEDEFRGFIHGFMDYNTHKFRSEYSVSMRDTKKDLKKRSKYEKGQFKLSTIGYLMFNNYYVNLDNCVPIPFLVLNNDSIPKIYYDQGVKIRDDETIVLLGDAILSSTSYQDIYFRNKKYTLATQKIDACKYFIDRSSVVSDFVMEDDKLIKIFELMRDEPLYYTMILTKNNKGISPLEEAIDNNSPKIVELMLASLAEIPEFKLSNAIYHKFEQLFDMGIDAFRGFLKICYFETGQTKMMKKMDTKGRDGIILDYSNSSLLSERFNNIFLTRKQHDQPGLDEDEEEEDNKSENEGEDESDEREVETLISDISIPDIDDQLVGRSDSSLAVEKRVEVKAIEFDWLLTTKDGERFLEALSETEVLSFFEIDLVKNVVLFQWSYYLPRIIIGLFLPFFIHFLIFLIYATWLLEEKKEENDDDWGKWYTVDFVFGIIILVYQIFFIYVEIHQMIFHKMRYFKSFWNMLDIISILLNIATVILDITDRNPDDVNLIACIAVLIVWFR